MTGAVMPAIAIDGASHLAAEEARLIAGARAAVARLGRRDCRLGVVGAGTMGRTIALAGLEAGLDVVLVDNNPAQLQAARADLARWATKAGLAAVPACSDDLVALAGASVVVESVFEDAAIKIGVLRAIEAVVDDHALITTNSSSLDIDRLAAALDRPDRFIGTHFFLPAHRTPVLEIVAGRASAPATSDRAQVLALMLGKLPIRAGNCDGYVGNRLFDSFWQEAAFLVEEGALPEAVDAALTGWGMALGPLATLDRIGNDLLAAVLARRAAERPGIRQPAIVARLVAEGRVGVRAGRGWYDYPDGGRQGVPSARFDTTGRAVAPEAIVARCVGAVIREGRALLAEGMAQSAGDIDVMFVRAYGFPMATGGPMYLAAE